MGAAFDRDTGLLEAAFPGFLFLRGDGKGHMHRTVSVVRRNGTAGKMHGLQRVAVDVSCEEIIPLPQLIEQRRARADAMEREMRDIEVLPNGTVRVLPKPGSNDSGD